MGHVIPLHGDPHEATQRLLPWYLTGTLDPAEHGLVEQHLSDCEACRADLAGEQRLHDAVKALPPAPSGQWETLRERALQAGTRPPAVRRWSFGSGATWMALAASQLAILFLGIGAYDWMRPRNEADYHTLSSPTATHAGNLIVIFRPDVPEQQFRAALNAVGARLADGPTAAGAYVLSVPESQRDSSLGKLRARPDVILAQPIDDGPVQ